MATVVNTNLAAIYARTNLSGAQNSLSTSVERLSSGLRINSAKDDAAGLGISEKLKSQITTVNQAIRNANDAISMSQVAEGAMTQISDILIRIKELSTQAVNGSLSTDQLTSIVDEIKQLNTEMGTIADRTTFNAKPLLKASTITEENATAAVFQIGAGTSDTMTINFRNIIRGTTVTALTTARTTAAALTSASDFAAFQGEIESAITYVTTQRATLGAGQNRLEYAIANMQAQTENMQAANSRIVDTDFAAETAELTRTQIMQQAATAMLAQANQMPNVILALLK